MQQRGASRPRAGFIPKEFIENNDLPPDMVIAGMNLVCVLPRMVPDEFALVFVTAPLFAPTIEGRGCDAIRRAAAFIIGKLTAYITPPFGYNLFDMRAATALGIAINGLCKAALPVLFPQMFGHASAAIFPGIARRRPTAPFGP